MQSPEERFAALFGANAPALLGYAVRRVVDPADAADVVAETFLVAWRRLDDVPPGDQARPWLFGVARNVLANLRRGERRRLALADRLRTELVTVVPAAEPVDDTLDRAWRRLGEDDREVLRLVAWEELARDEIALVLGISRGAVRVRLHRARRRLAQVMAELAADDGEPEATRMPLTGQVIGGRAFARPGESEA